jgi:hypothetical protein
MAAELEQGFTRYFAGKPFTLSAGIPEVRIAYVPWGKKPGEPRKPKTSGTRWVTLEAAAQVWRDWCRQRPAGTTLERSFEAI